jgi:hypothetical protein
MWVRSDPELDGGVMSLFGSPDILLRVLINPLTYVARIPSIFIDEVF